MVESRCGKILGFEILGVVISRAQRELDGLWVVDGLRRLWMGLGWWGSRDHRVLRVVLSEE